MGDLCKVSRWTTYQSFTKSLSGVSKNDNCKIVEWITFWKFQTFRFTVFNEVNFTNLFHVIQKSNNISPLATCLAAIPVRWQLHKEITMVSSFSQIAPGYRNVNVSTITSATISCTSEKWFWILGTDSGKRFSLVFCSSVGLPLLPMQSCTLQLWCIQQTGNESPPNWLWHGKHCYHRMSSAVAGSDFFRVSLFTVPAL